MRYLGILIVTILLLSGCETLSVQQYLPTQQNTSVIKNVMMMSNISSLAVGEFTTSHPGQFESLCGINKLIRIPNNTPPDIYIRNALINEIKEAGVYSLDQIEAERVITGHLDTFKLDSDTGSWIIQVTISLNTGDVYTVSETYEHDEISCERAASTLVPAVQDLIYKIVSNPAFQRKMESNPG